MNRYIIEFIASNRFDVVYSRWLNYLKIFSIFLHLNSSVYFGICFEHFRAYLGCLCHEIWIVQYARVSRRWKNYRKIRKHLGKSTVCAVCWYTHATLASAIISLWLILLITYVWTSDVILSCFMAVTFSIPLGIVNLFLHVARSEIRPNIEKYPVEFSVLVDACTTATHTHDNYGAVRFRVNLYSLLVCISLIVQPIRTATEIPMSKWFGTAVKYNIVRHGPQENS